MYYQTLRAFLSRLSTRERFNLKLLVPCIAIIALRGPLEALFDAQQL